MPLFYLPNSPPRPPNIFPSDSKIGLSKLRRQAPIKALITKSKTITVPTTFKGTISFHKPINVAVSTKASIIIIIAIIAAVFLLIKFNYL